MTKLAVITGMGAVTPVGNDRESTWKALRAGQSGVGPITQFNAEEQQVRIAAEVRDFRPESFLDHKRARRCARLSQFAIAAAREALADAKLSVTEDNAARVGVVINSAVAGMGEIERATNTLRESGARKVSPYFVSSVIPNMAACEVAIDIGAHGPVTASALACASGNYALLAARRMIVAGEADVVIAGGTDSAITPVMFAGLTNMGPLSTRNDDPAGASRPFDADRDGFVFGEGAVIHVVESAAHAKARGAVPYAEIAGGALTSDAFHVSAPERTGKYAAAAIAQALRAADLTPADIDYVCAHGTGTRANDVVETRAIRAAFGPSADHVPVSSPKSMAGHLIGAAGSLSVLTCALAIRDQEIPPTINLYTPDPECDLDYVPNVARPAKVTATITNAFGFGGQNCVVVLRAT